MQLTQLEKEHAKRVRSMLSECMVLLKTQLNVSAFSELYRYAVTSFCIISSSAAKAVIGTAILSSRAEERIGQRIFACFFTETTPYIILKMSDRCIYTNRHFLCHRCAKTINDGVIIAYRVQQIRNKYIEFEQLFRKII